MDRPHSPGFLGLVGEAKKVIDEIDIAAYKKMRESGQPHLLIDVREDNEYEAGHAARDHRARYRTSGA